MTSTLSWLTPHPDFDAAIRMVLSAADPQQQYQQLRTVAVHDLDLAQIGQVDRLLKGLDPTLSGAKPLKLAYLGPFTIDYLFPALRVNALRRGLTLEIYKPAYNQYRHELMDPTSGFHQFKPDVTFFAHHPNDLGLDLSIQLPEEEIEGIVSTKVDEWTALWSMAQTNGSTVIHQTLVSPPFSYFGHLDALIPATPASLIYELNHRVRKIARQHQVLLMDMERTAAYVGTRSWWDLPFWYHAKHAVPMGFAAWYTDQIARILAATRGLSSKCLVLDLDNTLWGGVIGDDGLGGIALGQGDAVGEAHQEFQRFAKRLKDRGVILAVCSKNEEATARLPFETHPESVLKMDDFSIFVANWDDKATNLKRIAQRLNIGLDSLVFVDDNPAERAIVRQYVPEVIVPELPDDPAYYASCLTEAGYFEAISFTQDDVERTRQYQANAQRSELMATGNIDDFLQGLSMEMVIAPFDEVGRSRIAQLINKSNQFNLTTRRYTEAQVKEFEHGSDIVTFQIRLKDRLGDNGMISVVIARPSAERDELFIDTWLMSCRVLGRQVEDEVLNALVRAARDRGCKYLRGEYIPTPKNELVRDHFKKLGFSPVEVQGPNGVPGHTQWQLDVESFQPHPTFIKTKEATVHHA